MNRFFPVLSAIVLLAGLAIFAGCGEEPAPSPQTPPKTTTPAAPAAAAPAPEAKKPEAKPAESKAAEEKAKPTESADKPETTPQPGTTVEKAESGAGKKGHYGKGFVTTPVSTIFRAQERMAFEVQIPHAIDIFEAAENRPLKSHEEFMDRIIKDNQIKLPELPEGHRYLFDTKTKQLMIEKPAE
jgi:hypothetical protein